MTTTTPAPTELRRDLRQVGTLLIVAGVLGTIAGILAIVYPDITLLALALIAGINLMLLGVDEPRRRVQRRRRHDDARARRRARPARHHRRPRGDPAPGREPAGDPAGGRHLVRRHRPDRLHPRVRRTSSTARCGCSPRSSTSCSAASSSRCRTSASARSRVLIGIAFVVRGVISIVRGLPAPQSRPGMIGGHLEEYRALRQQLEEEILAIASSVDGRRFELQAPLRGLELPPGGYAMLEDEHGSRLGQVLSVRLEQRDAAELEWEGERRRPRGQEPARDPRRPRRGRDPERRRRAVPRRRHPRRRPPRRSARGSARAPATARASRSASCGWRRACRSRSTPAASTATRSSAASPARARRYSLGVVLEQLLLHTGLRIIILDPNSDFARLASARAGVDEATAERWRALARRHRRPHRRRGSRGCACGCAS